MTAQFSDAMKYRGKSYIIAGKNGKGLFDPAAHGLNVVGRCSACWRGFVCTYALEDEFLILDTLDVSLEVAAPPLFGVLPKQHAEELPLFTATYEGLVHPLSYTGGLLLAEGFIEKLYVHMGFHPAWKYRKVHELVFYDGVLLSETDRSSQMAELRKKLTKQPLEPGRHDDVRKWIENCFSEDYNL